jgi:hypothetical protein
MVISLLSTGLDIPALALTSDGVWDDDKLLHLSGLPVTYMGEDPLSPLCGTVGSKMLFRPLPHPYPERDPEDALGLVHERGSCLLGGLSSTLNIQ